MSIKCLLHRHLSIFNFLAFEESKERIQHQNAKYTSSQNKPFPVYGRYETVCPNNNNNLESLF